MGTASFAQELVDKIEKALELQNQRGAAMAKYYADLYKNDVIPTKVDARNAIEREQDMLTGLIKEQQEASRVAREEAEAIQKDLIPSLSSLQSARLSITAILDRENQLHTCITTS